jgi:hypothetical protein
MEQQQNFFNILLFIAVIFGTYYIYSVVNRNVNNIEGMTMEGAFADATTLTNDMTESATTAANSATKTATSTVNGANGIAGNGAAFLQNLKDQTNIIREKLNLTNPEYRKNTEDIILQLDEYLNYLGMQTILTINGNNANAINAVTAINNSRAALNNALKFLDKQ